MKCLEGKMYETLYVIRGVAADVESWTVRVRSGHGVQGDAG